MDNEQATPMIAVKRFFEKDAKPVSNTEFIAFWKSLSDEEKQSFGESAATQLGLVLKGTSAG